MDFEQITKTNQLEEAIAASSKKPVLIFKHSTRCSISSTALHRLERNAGKLQKAAGLYLINVIQNRDISNAIAEETDVRHESPQALVFMSGKCIFHTSHLAIDTDSVLEAIQKQSEQTA